MKGYGLHFAESDVLTCQTCGQSTPRRGPVQKYCEPCSGLADLERKRRWASAHPLPLEVSRAKGQRTSREARIRGRQISAASTRTIAGLFEPLPPLVWRVAISHPFCYGLSKNAIYRLGLEGHVTLRKEARKLRNDLIVQLRSALSQQKIYQGKVWLDILVQKPDHKGDAVNVVDTVCDAAKVALGVDDRWFSIRRLDWEVSKTDPKIYVGIGQEISEDHRICACCGRSLPYGAFPGQKRLGRECKQCLRVEAPEPRPEPDRMAVVHNLEP